MQKLRNIQLSCACDRADSLKRKSLSESELTPNLYNYNKNLTCLQVTEIQRTACLLEDGDSSLWRGCLFALGLAHA